MPLDDAPGIGHNSAAPTLSSEQLEQLKSDMLDPGMISDQLGIDYAHHIRRRDELLGGVARLIIQFGNPQQVEALPDEGSRGAMVVLKGDGRPYAWTIPPASDGGDPCWKPADLGEFIRLHIGSVVIADVATANKATSFGKQLKDTASKAVEPDRVREKTPYDNAAKVVQAFFKDAIQDKLTFAAKGIESALSAYQARLAEEERKRRLEEARKAQEEADRAAAAAQRTQSADVLDTAIELTERAEKLQAKAVAPVADMARVSGSLGGTSAALTNWDFEVEDETKIPREYWVLDRSKILAQVKREKDACRIPGIRVKKDIKASIR